MKYKRPFQKVKDPDSLDHVTLHHKEIKMTTDHLVLNHRRLAILKSTKSMLGARNKRFTKFHNIKQQWDTNLWKANIAFFYNDY